MHRNCLCSQYSHWGLSHSRYQATLTVKTNSLAKSCASTSRWCRFASSDSAGDKVNVQTVAPHNSNMYKKEVKQKIKEFNKAVEENTAEMKVLDILRPVLPEHREMNRTQKYIQDNVNLYTKEKAFDITMDNGPYKCKYTSNGSNMLVENSRGYLAAFNTQSLDLSFETEMGEEVHDTAWLHNEMYFATAQKDSVFVYDNKGHELHAVRDMKCPRQLEFLPYHFLLASTTRNGFLNYLDTSTGEMAGTVFVGDKTPTAMRASPANGVVHLGSKTGNVSLWSPAQKEYLMKIRCNKAGVSSIEIDRTGAHLVTVGNDNKIRVFDTRNTYRPVETVSSKTAIHFTSLSQRGLLAIGYSDKVVVLKGYRDVYTRHRAAGPIASLAFCGHEDILTVGHAGGFSSIVVPGAGDPNYDSAECRPFMTVKERRAHEVKRLLEKIPAGMIGLGAAIGAEEAEAGREETQRAERPRTALSRFYD